MTGHPLWSAGGVLLLRKLIGVALVAVWLLSCSGLPLRSDGPRGIYHRVKKGETLSAIARAYHINLKDLAEINAIDKPDQLETDSVIFIPDVSQVVDDVLAAGRSQPAPVAPPVSETPQAVKKPVSSATAPTVARKETVKPGKEVPPEQAAKAQGGAKGALSRGPGGETAPPRPLPSPRGEAAAPPPPLPGEGDAKGEKQTLDKGRFIWPVKGKVISRFGDQPNKMRFNGIRIAAPEGAAVQAAAGGVVIYSAHLKGYGETVIIEHDDGYATVYTHLETRTVRKDHRVKQGDRIAFLGKAENQEEPYLHFEIRQKYLARNPLLYLP